LQYPDLPPAPPVAVKSVPKEEVPPALPTLETPDGVLLATVVTAAPPAPTVIVGKIWPGITSIIP
jgi:hypothetical protein